MDHIPRQDIIEADVGKRQRVGETLVQAHRQAARRGCLAYHREPDQAAVDRLDIEAVLGEQQRMPADTATEIEHPPGTARVQFRQDRYYCRVRFEPIGAPFAGGPTLVPSLDRRLRHRTADRHLPRPLSRQTMPSCRNFATAAASRPSQSDSTW